MKVSKLLIKYGSDKARARRWVGHAYGPYYDELFQGDIKDILEVGVHFGGSVRAWCKAFPKAQVDGIEIDSTIFKGDKPKNFNLIIGDVKEVVLNKKYDIIIDDGSHSFTDQAWVIQNLSKLLKENGTLVVEDIGVEQYLEDFKQYVPEGFKMEVIDLRKTQDWTDDVLVVISKS